MPVEKRIDHLVEMGVQMREHMQDIPFDVAKIKNPWFEPVFVKKSLNAILDKMLNREVLENFASRYSFSDAVPSDVGLILAGNIPLVGFHDILVTYLSGHRAQIKTSSKDDFLIPLVWQLLFKIDKGANEQLRWVDQLQQPEAVIATGSNNSFRYFEYYFKDVPHILRHNRTSAAVITGDESATELEGLADDIFTHFGLGCRNVSHLLLPEGYDATQIFEHSKSYEWLSDYKPFRNNHDYRLAMYIMNRDEHLASDFLTMRKSEELHAPIGVLHYHFYDSEETKEQWLNQNKSSLQCVVGKDRKDGRIPFGKTQEPGLSDYPDGLDVMEFLLGLFN